MDLHLADPTSAVSQPQKSPEYASERSVGGPGAPSDRDLVIAFWSGKGWAASTIVRRYRRMVRLTLARWTGCRDVDDLAQEVFACLFERVRSLQQPAALRSFIIGITLRIVCSELRRRRRARLRVTATGEVPEPEDYYRRTAHHAPEAREALSRMEDVLARLSPSARHAFLLRCVFGMELTELASELGVSLSTAKRRVARAKSCVAAMVVREPALAGYVATSLDPSLRSAPSNSEQDDRNLRREEVATGQALKQVAQSKVA